eukprot:scaffold3043_cov180-Amphora_coffeaeformis.AAC.11
MPWWCLPLQFSGVVDRLSATYHTKGIPHLVVLDKDGTVLKNDAIHQVLNDPKGDKFPWRPSRLVDLLPQHYLRADGTKAPMASLDDKYLLLIASASWCPPGERLIPYLAQVYRHLRAAREDDFEFLYLSSDRNQAEFDAVFAHLGFGAIPFEERQMFRDIAQLFDIRCVPTMLMFGPKHPTDPACDRPLLNGNVRDIFCQNTTSPETLVHEFPWCPLKYGDLNQVSDNINDMKCVIVFCEACDDEEQEEIRKALRAASEAYDGCSLLRFYWACESTQLTKILRETLHLGPCMGAHMVLMDIPSNASYYVGTHDVEISIESVLDFVQQPGAAMKLC